MKFISSAKDQDTTPSARRTAEGPGADSLIAAGTTVDGDCSTVGSLRIDGRVTGSIRARQLTVGPDGRVEGDVSGPDGGPAEGGVVIDGRVDGGVRAPRVEVGKNGSVGAGLHVREAEIRGRVVGPVIARARLVLEETAVVEGNVTAPRIAVREGGRVSGTIRIGAADDEAGAANEPRASADRQPAGHGSGAVAPGGPGGAETTKEPGGSEEPGASKQSTDQRQE